MKIKICHLYPDVLNLYGDRGNIICLEKRLAWRGIEAEIIGVPIGEEVDFSSFDLFFLGGGQDFEQKLLLEDLRRGKGREIKAAIEDGGVFLAICGGYQILGNSYTPFGGEPIDFIGALDMQTIGQEKRMIGNYMFHLEDLDYNIVGFENHSGKTYLAGEVRPMGRVLSGFGNNGEDRTEGARYKNVFACYAHGPILPKNPAFCDHLLQLAIEKKHPDFVLAQLDDRLEQGAHDYMGQRLSQ